MTTHDHSTEGAGRLSRHEVKNLVVFCMDFRFKSDLHKAVQEAFGIDDFDELKLAGGAGNLALLGLPERKKALLDDIALAVNAHKVENIYLLNHQNCGAYAMAGHAFPKQLSDEEKEFHAGELARSTDEIKKLFPHVTVHAALVAVDHSDDRLTVCI